jgi:phage gp29-like protein
VKPTAFSIDEETNRLFLAFNPLRGMSAKDVENILDFSLTGCISRLELIYERLEQASVDVATIKTRREAALIGCDWEIRKRENATKSKELDKLADEQVAMLNENFARAEDSGTLVEAIKCLGTAIFRGIAVVEPRFSDKGLEYFECYSPWNFAIDPLTKDVYWNPKAIDLTNFQNTLKKVTGTRCIVSLEETPVDGLALPVYIRENFGEESWARLIARRGLPACYIIAPPLAGDKVTQFTNAAKKVAEGGSGALPNGSQVITEKMDAANSDAFDLFLAHQQKQIILAGTGGLLGSLAEATGLGSGVSDAHENTWREIIKCDAMKISNLINRKVAHLLLDAYFPGQPKLAYFTMDSSTPKSATEVLDCAVKATQAGYEIDEVQLSEMTGFKLRKRNQESQEVDENGQPVPEQPKEDKPIDEEADKQEQAEEEKVKNSAPVEEPKNEVNEEDVKQKASLVKAFDLVINPVRFILGKLFKAKTPDEEAAIIQELDELTKKIESQDENEYITAIQLIS